MKHTVFNLIEMSESILNPNKGLKKFIAGLFNIEQAVNYSYALRVTLSEGHEPDVGQEYIIAGVHFRVLVVRNLISSYIILQSVGVTSRRLELHDYENIAFVNKKP